jgi:hypothetical protein
MEAVKLAANYADDADGPQEPMILRSICVIRVIRGYFYPFLKWRSRINGSQHVDASAAELAEVAGV